MQSFKILAYLWAVFGFWSWLHPAPSTDLGSWYLSKLNFTSTTMLSTPTTYNSLLVKSISLVDVQHLHCELGFKGGDFPSDPSNTMSSHCSLARQLQRHLVDKYLQQGVLVEHVQHLLLLV